MCSSSGSSSCCRHCCLSYSSQSLNSSYRPPHHSFVIISLFSLVSSLLTGIIHCSSHSPPQSSLSHLFFIDTVESFLVFPHYLRHPSLFLSSCSPVCGISSSSLQFNSLVPVPVPCHVMSYHLSLSPSLVHRMILSISLIIALSLPYHCRQSVVQSVLRS